MQQTTAWTVFPQKDARFMRAIAMLLRSASALKTTPEIKLDLDPCGHQSPCPALAACINMPSPGSYQCLCPAGLTGALCETNLTALCLPDACANGGHCTIEGDGYECSCPTGYDGRDCELTTSSEKSGSNGVVTIAVVIVCVVVVVAVLVLVAVLAGTVYSKMHSRRSKDTVAVETHNGYPISRMTPTAGTSILQSNPAYNMLNTSQPGADYNHYEVPGAADYELPQSSHHYQAPAETHTYYNIPVANSRQSSISDTYANEGMGPPNAVVDGGNNTAPAKTQP